MTNKNAMKKCGIKGLAAILLAANLMSAATPVLAATDETMTVAAMNQESDTEAQQAADPASETTTPEETPATVLPVKVKGDDKPAADGSADKYHPIYTANVTIENGTLAEDFTENDIEFTGIFKNAAIQNLTVNETRTGFTLVFTKEYGEGTQFFEGGMTLKGRAVLDGADQASQKDFSVYLYDSYRPVTEEPAVVDDKMTDKEFEEILRTITNAGLDIAMTGFFGLIVPQNIVGRMTKFAGDMGVQWTAEKADVAMSSSEEQLKAIQNLSSQLSQATYSIMKNVDYNQLATTASFIDSKVSLVKGDYRNYLNTMNTLYAKAEQGTLAKNPTYLNDRMEAVYAYGNGNPILSKDGMANFTCYDHLYDLGEMMLGHGLFGSKNIFQIYQGIASNKYNYNTMSFADRRAYNETVLNFYEQGYAALMTAISYDLEKNTALENEYTKELEDLENLSDKTLSDSAKKTLNAKMEKVEAARDTARDAIKSDESRMADLQTQKSNLLAAKQASDDIINAEEAAPYVICYCNNVKYNKDLAVSASTPENFAVKGAFSEADVDNFIKFSQYAQGTMGGCACSISWEPKSQWNDKQDNSFSGADAFKNSIVYSCDQNSDMNYLEKIANDKGHTLAEELGEAFQYQGKPAATAIAEGVADGYYKGGNFTFNEVFFKNRYCYEKTVFYFFHDFTEGTYYNYNWANFNHNVNYVDGKGDNKTNVETRKFAMTAERSFSGSSVPAKENLHKEEGFDGKSVNLFLVNTYGA